MRSFFSGDGYRLPFGPVHVRIVLSPKAFLVAAAILSALALTPNFKRVKTVEAEELPPRPVAPDASNRMPPSPLSVKPPSGMPGINDLLYLEDFGTNLYTIDSMTGAASLAPSDNAGMSSSAFSGTANGSGSPVTSAAVAWGDLPALARVTSTRVTGRPAERGARSVAPSGGGDFAGGSPGAAASGQPSPPAISTGHAPPASSPLAPDEGDRGSPGDYTPNPTRFGPLDWSSTEAPGLSSGDPLPALLTRNRQPSGSSGVEPPDPPPLADAPLFPSPELSAYSALLSVTAFSTTELATAQVNADNLAGEITQSLQARVSFDSASPVPEPRGNLLVPVLLLLITLHWGRYPSIHHHSARRYNTGQKRARSVSEVQPMFKTLTLFTSLLALSAFAPSAFAQKDLPEGAGRPATVRVCTGCHGAEMFSATRLGPAEWDRMIANMTTERGFAITDADYATVLKYLTTYMAPPKANLSKAPEAK